MPVAYDRGDVSPRKGRPAFLSRIEAAGAVTPEIVRQILSVPGIGAPWRDIGDDAALVAARINDELELADGAGIAGTVSSLVLSLGAAINRAGSALFQAGALVFLATLYDVPLPFTTLVSAGFVGFVVAMSVAPVPSASIVTLAPILEVAGVPLGGLGLLLGIDRIPDMFRSATNITGHVAAAVTVEGLRGKDLTED